MISRKNENQNYQELNLSYIGEAVELLHRIYSLELEKRKKIFKVFGQEYHNEIVLTAMLTDPKNLLAPITYIASIDLDIISKKENETHKELIKIKEHKEEKIKTLIDSVGYFFDSFFADKDPTPYNTDWTEVKIKNQKYYYQVTIENVELSIIADKLLAKEV